MPFAIRDESGRTLELPWIGTQRQAATRAAQAWANELGAPVILVTDPEGRGGRGPGRRQERFEPKGPRGGGFSANASGEVVIRALPADLMEEFGSVEFPPYSHTPQAVEVYQKIQRGEGVDSNELLAAAGQLHHHGYKKLAARLTSLAKDPPSELLGVDATPTINMRLTAEELNGLGWIANRYESGRLLYGAYDDEAGTFEVDEVIAAYRATAGDGGDLGTVPNAGASLAKKIDLLFDKSGAYYLEDDE